MLNKEQKQSVKHYNKREYRMEKLISKMGYTSAITGFLLCAFAGVARLSGKFFIFNLNFLIKSQDDGSRIR